MSNLSLFLKKNKAKRENTTYVATRSLCNEAGNPVEWVIKPLTTNESEQIRDECTIEVPVTGKPNVYRHKTLMGKYLAKLIAVSVVEPNLYSAELQDSYGVKTPEDLIKEMIDDPGEYNEFVMFIQQFNNMDTTLQDKVDEAKN